MANHHGPIMAMGRILVAHRTCYAYIGIYICSSHPISIIDFSRAASWLLQAGGRGGGLAAGSCSSSACSAARRGAGGSIM